MVYLVFFEKSICTIGKVDNEESQIQCLALFRRQWRLFFNLHGGVRVYWLTF